MATLNVPPSPPYPRDDATHLYKAFKGFGCDTSAVINILAHRDATQRALIQQEYRAMYSEELTKRLVKELSGKLEEAILLWLQDPPGRDAEIVRQACTRGDARTVTEVICSRTPSQIQIFKQIYHARYGTYLEHDIEGLTSGDHKKLLLAYISIPRYEGLEFDRFMADNDAKALYKAGEKRLGTDEHTLIMVFSERNRAHLAAVASSYHSMYHKSLEKAVKSETSGMLEYGLLSILRCAENPGKYFAKVLHRAMKCLGTDDTTLIRVVVTRTELDMQYIKAEYHKKYKKTLNDAVSAETSGDYKAFLLALLGPKH
ncbi:Annexin D5-like protein [Drosera capensis]